MKRYIENLQAKSPHDQRMHAIRLSSILTAFIFFVWITAAGVRLSFTALGPTGGPNNAEQTSIAGGVSQNSQLGSVISAVSGGGSAAGTSDNTLVVATTTDIGTGNSLVSPQ